MCHPEEELSVEEPAHIACVDSMQKWQTWKATHEEFATARIEIRDQGILGIKIEENLANLLGG